MTDSLQNDTAKEVQRRVTSLQARESRQARVHSAFKADPPTAQDLAGVIVHVDCADAEVPLTLEAAAARNHSYLVGPAQRHRAGISIADNPWAPRAVMVTWAAVLLGRWVMTPSVYMGRAQGPAVLYKAALATKRQVWVSNEVRTQHPELWLLLLEAMSATPPAKQRWKLLQSPCAWAAAKAAAIKGGRAAEVLASVLSQADPAAHVMGPSDFLKSIQHAQRSMLGLGGN